MLGRVLCGSLDSLMEFSPVEIVGKRTTPNYVPAYTMGSNPYHQLNQFDFRGCGDSIIILIVMYF